MAAVPPATAGIMAAVSGLSLLTLVRPSTFGLLAMEPGKCVKGHRRRPGSHAYMPAAFGFASGCGRRHPCPLSPASSPNAICVARAPHALRSTLLGEHYMWNVLTSCAIET